MKRAICILSFGVMASWVSATTIVGPDEDVMTSAFFTNGNFVRGYNGEEPVRVVHRVSSDDAFGTGPETIYLDFSSFSPSEVNSATLTMESVSGGFDADAGLGNPFVVSAHGVALNPFDTIIDDDTPEGNVTWDLFFENQILPTNAAAITAVESFGAVTFDVTELLQSWESNPLLPRIIALTGKNDVQVDHGFLHGFNNNSVTPGSTFLTINAIPEPSAGLLSGLAWLALLKRRRLGAEARAK